MAGSKSSHTVRNIVIALLALWSIISLIIIVVWATSPELRSAAECNNKLKELRVENDKERGVWAEDRLAMEAQVMQGRTNQSLLENRILHLKSRLAALNHTLDSCTQENVLLNDNITALKDEIELHKAVEANLTANLALQEEAIELLQHNLTQASIELESCINLQKAAENRQTAAEKQTQACQASNVFTQKQLQKCKSPSQITPGSDGPPGPRTGNFLLGILGLSLLLIL